MTRLAWKPWHEVVHVREELKTGKLSLSTFAADLYDVVMGKARPIYQNPADFFSFTYPTFNLRELAKDVVLRLAGKNDKAVRQLELTYGGGKTHTLITLYHLTHQPQQLPDLPSVQEFTQHIGMAAPKARIAVLAFDKLDAEKGMEIVGPDETRRWLRQPWSVLAYQLAGSAGLRLLHAEGEDAERESAPAENLLSELLALPRQEGLATLILIDEVLMYVREKVGLDPNWRGRLIDFFQYLTQAATKVETCAIVASLLATDPHKSDTLGKELTQELYNIFRREREEGVQPVLKEDAAEVLRRRFFTPESIRDRSAFRPHVQAALRGIAALDDHSSRDMRGAEERFLPSYPFHPDLTDIFYTKWTNMEGFQRTRGVLRTFALALRDAETWDTCPLIATNVFLGQPGSVALSESARELTSIAETEEYEGRHQEWTGILEGELAKARDIQTELPALRFREVEQAVFATFLHSQPIGRDARTRELLTLVGATQPDKIELEKALQRWTELSWFLDESTMQNREIESSGIRHLPKSWRLGSRPNLHQMHHDACSRIAEEAVEEQLLKEIQKCKSLTAGASAAGARVHLLPERPRDIDDDGDFHYAILGPKAASSAGRPSAEAKRFLDEKTGPDSPRVYRNAVVLAVPSLDGLVAARNAIRDELGWQDVEDQLKGQEVDNNRRLLLDAAKKEAASKATEMVRQAYCIVVTVSAKNEVQAFKVVVSGDALFAMIKADPQARIQETAVTAEALLPEGPYDLWRAGESARRMKDLVEAFAQISRLPKMLNRKAIQDTLLEGCRAGLFVFRLSRPDHSYRTFWHELPDEVALREPALEVVLPESAELAALSPTLLVPDALPELWHSNELMLRDLYAYFSGRVLSVQRDGYDDQIAIPRADHAVVDVAVQEAVKEKRLWLLGGRSSFYAEDVPIDVLAEDAILQRPPQPISLQEIVPTTLPEAWHGNTTTALDIANALSTKVGKTLPWYTVREAITNAIHSRWLETTIDSGPWPCDFANARNVRLSLPREQRTHSAYSTISAAPTPSASVREPISVAAPGQFIAEATIGDYEIQNLADLIGELRKETIDLELIFHLRVELGPISKVSDTKLAKVNELLAEVTEELRLRRG
jgi:hypothetical protein